MADMMQKRNLDHNTEIMFPSNIGYDALSQQIYHSKLGGTSSILTVHGMADLLLIVYS